MRRVLAGILLWACASAGAISAERSRLASAELGLAVELDKSPSPAVQRRLLDEIRRTGVSLFALSLSWSSAEPAVGQYRIADLTRTARLLRQSGATLHLDLPLVVARARDVPQDLAGMAFDDERLSVRLGRLLDALEPALLDFATLSLGYKADAYFADKPEELRAYRRLFDGAVQFLVKKVPHLKIGVTTAAPTESPAPVVAAALHQRSPVRFYIYSPFALQTPFFHRSPDAFEHDWKMLLEGAGSHPIAFPEVSFSSAKENGSSPEAQAEFIRRLRRFLASSDGQKLLFARYVPWRDPPGGPPSMEPNATDTERRRAIFFASRGLQTAKGEPKPAWREWIRAGR